ncbi:MAG: hypothetical protein IT459_17250 [Planctomycetes bacterium]|nr:hypothetical protein [Planctomycetota bacterium]
MALRGLPGGYEERERGRFRVAARSDALAAFVAAGALDGRPVSELGRVVAPVGGGRAQASCIEIPGIASSLLAKRVTRGGLLAPIVPDVFAFDRGYAELLVTETLRAQGVRVPALVAVRLTAVHGWIARGAIELFVEWRDGASDLVSWCARPRSRAERTRGLRNVGVELARMHAAGVVHEDLNARNVLVDGSGQAWLVDLGASRVAQATPARRIENLVRLLRSAAKTDLLGSKLTTTDLVRVARGYAGTQWKSIWSEVTPLFIAALARHAWAWRVFGKGTKA